MSSSTLLRRPRVWNLKAILPLSFVWILCYLLVLGRRGLAFWPEVEPTPVRQVCILLEEYFHPNSYTIEVLTSSIGVRVRRFFGFILGENRFLHTL